MSQRATQRRGQRGPAGVPMRPAPRASCRQRGVALAIVLWFIAGMSLLVATVVLSSRTDARLAQVHQHRAQATAAGDGAISLLLADLLDERFAVGEDFAPALQSYRLGEHSVSVLAVATENLVDINKADAALLAAALRRSAVLPPESAGRLADAVVQWRSGSSGTGAQRRLEAPEDLLSVEGMNRTVWEGLRDYLALARGGGGLLRAGPAAERALNALFLATPGWRLSTPQMGLSRGADGLQLRSLDGEYRVDALLQLGDRVWLRRRWVSMSNARGGLPWRILRSEPARIVTPIVDHRSR